MITIFLIDKHALVRAGIRYIIGSTEDMSVVGEAESIRDALDEIARVRPNIVLLEISEIDDNADSALESLATISPDSVVLGLAGAVDEEIHELAIRQGARGVVMTFETEETLLKAIRKVYDGEAWINRRVAGKILKQDTDADRRRAQNCQADHRRARKPRDRKQAFHSGKNSAKSPHGDLFKAPSIKPS
jgi:DNA-binding NarL/FixJ family response regulator